MTMAHQIILIFVASFTCSILASFALNESLVHLAEGITRGISMQIESVSGSETHREYILKEVHDIYQSNTSLELSDISRLSAMKYQYMESVHLSDNITSPLTSMTRSSLANLNKIESSILWDAITHGVEVDRMREYVTKTYRILIADFEARRNGGSKNFPSAAIDYLLEHQRRTRAIPLTVIPKAGQVLVVNMPHLAEWLMSTGWATISSVSTEIEEIGILSRNSTKFLPKESMELAGYDLCICASGELCCKSGDRIIFEGSLGAKIDVEKTEKINSYYPNNRTVFYYTE